MGKIGSTQNLGFLTVWLTIAAISISSCGRNPGAHSERADANPKCIQPPSVRIQNKVVHPGKEKFATGRAGRFRLETYEYARLSTLEDGAVPNLAITITDFEDLSSRAPRLAIDANCLDLKNLAQEINVSPVVEIDSEEGLIRAIQPLVFSAGANGKLSAVSALPVFSDQAVPVVKSLEATLLLGLEHAEDLDVVLFRVSERADGSMEVMAEFADKDLARIFIQVRAVYRWDAAP